jgi:uncharacterized membrane protein YhiD involved in acid resistance
MLKKNLVCLLCCLLVLTSVGRSVTAQQAYQPPTAENSTVTKPTDRRQVERQTALEEKVKIKIAKLGLGAKAKATIRLNDIAQAGEENFVIRDRKTDAPTTIRYADVVKVEENRGHSTARNIAIGVGIGVGALLLAIAISIAHLD